MNNQFFISNICIYSFGAASAQQPKHKKEVYIKTDSLSVLLQFYSPVIIRVTKTKLGKTSISDNNFSIVAAPQNIAVKEIGNGNLLNFYTDSICIQVHQKQEK